MISILVISDQPRIQKLLASAANIPEASFKLTSNINDLLFDPTDRSPDIIFLQNRLSGLAGSILVRHVRSQANSAHTRIILLHEGSGESGESTADIEISVTVSDLELSDAISEIIADHIEEPAQAAIKTVPFAQKLPETPVQIDHKVTDSVSLNPPAANNPQAQPQRKATILSTTPPPIQWEKKRLIIAIASISAAIVIAAIIIITVGMQPSKPAAVKPQPKNAPAVAPLKAQPQITSAARPPVVYPQMPTPSFIQPSDRDQGYTAANPGWEKYISDSYEFKIFRETEKIRALQVLDRTKEGISPKFFTKVLNEMTKRRDYRLIEKERKGEYLIKKGKVSESSKIIIYKDRNDATLHAFVIYFNEDIRDKGLK